MPAPALANPTPIDHLRCSSSCADTATARQSAAAPPRNAQTNKSAAPVFSSANSRMLSACRHRAMLARTQDSARLTGDHARASAFIVTFSFLHSNHTL